MVRNLSLTAQAETDLEDILHYTCLQYGESQEKKYFKILCDGMDLIVSNPFAGRLREELFSRYRTLPAGKHIIVYRVCAGDIFVLRILHQKMDSATRQTSFDEFPSDNVNENVDEIYSFQGAAETVGGENPAHGLRQ